MLIVFSLFTFDAHSYWQCSSLNAISHQCKSSVHNSIAKHQQLYHFHAHVDLHSRVAPNIISGPGSGRNPAKFSYPAVISGRAGYDRRIWGRIWGRIWPSFDASASLCNWAGIHCFTNSVICTSLCHHGHVDRTHILVSVCISLLVT